MSTTTVPKGSGRAAARERTNRHAQRTALPPKPGVVEAAREPISEPSARGARATCPVCTEDLSARGMPRHLKAHAERGEKEPSAAVEAPAESTPTDTPTKAHKHATAFSEAGWKVEVQTSDGGYAELIAVRGTETIHQAWVSGVYVPESASYTIGDRTVKTRNVAEALRWGKRSVGDAETEFAKVGSNKSFVKRAPAEKPKAAKLPFDPETVTEPELVAAIAGAKIRWMSRLSNQEETAIVHPDPRKIREEMQYGFRTVLFLCMTTGFRAFRLVDILSVSKLSVAALDTMEVKAYQAKAGVRPGRGKRTKASEIEPEEVAA